MDRMKNTSRQGLVLCESYGLVCSQRLGGAAVPRVCDLSFNDKVNIIEVD